VSSGRHYLAPNARPGPQIGESFVVILKEQFAPEASREHDSRVACLARSSLDTAAWRLRLNVGVAERMTRAGEYMKVWCRLGR